MIKFLDKKLGRVFSKINKYEFNYIGQSGVIKIYIFWLLKR